MGSEDWEYYSGTEGRMDPLQLPFLMNGAKRETRDR